MPSDTQNSVGTKREFRLSVIMATGLFLILTSVAVVIFFVTYQSTGLIVEQQRAHQHRHSNSISGLVMKGQMDSLRHVIDLASEDPNFRNLNKTGDRDNILSYLRSVFYAKKQSTIGFVALLSQDGRADINLHNELFPMDAILAKIGASYSDHNTWNWVSQESGLEGPLATLVYYKREMLDSLTGKVNGYLVGGFFLSDNQELVQEFRRQTDADFALLLWKGNVLAAAGNSPPGLLGPDGKFLASAVQSLASEYHLFDKTLMQRSLEGSEFSVINGFQKRSEKELQEFYLISAGIAVFLVLMLSIIAAMATRTIFLEPLRDLVLFARKTERQDSNPTLPRSLIADFNEVGANLAKVFTAFQESEKRFQDFVSVSSDSVWETDHENRYVFLSRDVSSTNKMDLNQILGKTRWEVMGVDP
ncbi:MAG: LuxQ periplasmic sensor domain-containing protein, partial [Sneathiella sp.]